MVTLRKAIIEDLELLRYWDKQDHVKASDPNDDWNWEVELKRTPKWRTQWIAEQESLPIGFIQIIDPHKEESHYWGKVGKGRRAIDIWIGEKTHLRKGYGTKMMALALEICFASEEVSEVLIDPLESNKSAIRFYKKIGFEFLEKRRFGEDDCEVYFLSKEKWMAQKT